MKRGEFSSLFFCYFLSNMKGKVYRVTYNMIQHVAELYMVDGEIKTIPMTEEEWESHIEGDVVENFSKLLDE